MGNGKMSAPLTGALGSTFYIDLAGHQLTAASSGLLSSYATRETYNCTQVGDGEVTAEKVSSVSTGWLKNNKVFVYSSIDGAKIIASSNLIYGKNEDGSGAANNNNFKYYIGYQSEDEIVDHRITVEFGADILDKNAIRTIGEKDYYVLTFDVAPKYGNKTCTLTVKLRGDKSVDFPMSAGNYAKALFALNGENNEYVADSQRMMKYVLTYIKEVAVRFGGANADEIFQGMDIAVDLDSVVIEEESKFPPTGSHRTRDLVQM